MVISVSFQYGFDVASRAFFHLVLNIQPWISCCNKGPEQDAVKEAGEKDQLRAICKELLYRDEDDGSYNKVDKEIDFRAHIRFLLGCLCLL